MVNASLLYFILFYQSILVSSFSVFSLSIKSSKSNLLVKSLSAATTTSSSSSSPVTVYDNVLPKESCDILHEIASKSGLGHKAFSRPLSSSPSLQNLDSPTMIETTLDAILTALGDDSTFVEYWTRQEWRHIEAHADVDEHLAKEQDVSISNNENGDDDSLGPFSFRYPENGHVLYLKIGTKVQGPTCVFPNVQSGGDLILGEDAKQSCSGEKKLTETMIVPAVNGRLLRFQGDALHAVPRPADLWLKSFVVGAPEYHPEEKWGRSVILFNTWKGEPPKNVPLDQNGLEFSDLQKAPLMQETLVNHVQEWDQVTPNVVNDNHRGESSESTSGVKIWLLGNERRRGYPMRTVKMKVASSSSSLKEALFESHNVSKVYLSS